MIFNHISILRGLSLMGLLHFLLVNPTYGLDYYWDKVPAGNYDDPGNWVDINGNPIGSIPTQNDDVHLYNSVAGHIDVYFPAGQTFYAFNLYVEDATLNFQGTNLNNVHIEVHGDLSFVSNVVTNYLNKNVNKWEIIGPGNNGEHFVDTKDIDLDDLTFDNDGITMVAKSDLRVGSTFRFYVGILSAEQININVGSIFVGTPGYSPDNSLDKELYLDNTILNCSRQYYCKFNDSGVVQLHGNYTITSPRYFLDDEYYDHIVLTNYDPPYNRDSLSMNVNGPIINHLEIDNDYLTRIGGSMTINNLLEVNNPGKTIEFSTFENFELNNELTINGSVSLPGGGNCNQLTTFNIKNENDYFFKRNSGSVTFYRAFIHNIKTKGGGSFNVNNGKVLGSTSYWNTSSNTSTVDYFWVDGSGNWFDPNHWSLETKVMNNPDGCIPRPVDNVTIDKFSFNGNNQEIQLDYSIGTACRDFTWIDNPSNGIIKLYKPPGYVRNPKPHLNTGSFKVGPDAIFDTNPAQQLYQIWLDGSGDLLLANSLPGLYLYIKGTGSVFNLTHDIDLDEALSIDAGTINTLNHDIVARSIFGADGEKTFNLGTSHIEADSLVKFCSNEFSPTTIIGSQSSIKARHLQANTDQLGKVELANDQLKNFSYDLRAKEIVFSGSGTTRFSFDSLVVDSLIFTNNAILEIGTNSGAGLRVNKGIRGPGAGAQEATIQSTSGTIQMTLESPRNLCIKGRVALEEVEALGGHVYHAEAGLDNGDNTGINFMPNTYTGNIYWNGYEDEFHLLKNWSNISGGCPTDLTNIKDADSLIVDEYGYNEDDTLFVNPNVTISNLVFRGENKDVFLRLYNSLFTSSISVADLKVEVLGDDEGMNARKLVRVSKNLSIKDQGKFYFENLNMEMGNAYPHYTSPVIGLWNTGGFDPLIICRGNSEVKILGTSFDLRNSTIYFGPNTGANLTYADFIIENQSPYEMKFDFQNFKVNSFTIDTPGNLNRDYIFQSNFRFNSMTLDDGNVIIESGVELKQEN